MHTGRRIFYQLRNFGRPANQLMFTRNENNQETASATAPEEISVANYFDQTYRKLLHPHLPCINASKGNQNKPNWLPMEVVWVSLSILKK